MQSLPDDEMRHLTELRDSCDLLRLRGRARELLTAGWTLQSIAVALNTYRSTVRGWATHPSYLKSATSALPLPLPDMSTEIPVPRPNLSEYAGITLPLLTVWALAPRLHDYEVTALHQLEELARRVRPRTAPDALSRSAATQLNRLVTHYRARGVPVADLAKACQVTPRALRARLPDPLPAMLPLDNPGLTSDDDYSLVVWPTSTRSRRYYTYVEQAAPNRPVAFPLGVLSLSHSTSANYHQISVAVAWDELGWHPTSIARYPAPKAST